MIGLHAHIGSQIFEKKVYFDEVEVIFNQIKRIKDKYGIVLKEVNLGGGLGIKYTEEDTPISVYEIAETIIESINIHAKKYDVEEPTVFIEPGRSIGLEKRFSLLARLGSVLPSFISKNELTGNSLPRR